MSATIAIGLMRATVTNGVWSTNLVGDGNEVWITLLDRLRDPLGPSGADPNADLTLARRAVARYGGEVVEWTNPEQGPPGTVY